MKDKSVRIVSTKNLNGLIQIDNDMTDLREGEGLCIIYIWLNIKEKDNNSQFNLQAFLSSIT